MNRQARLKEGKWYDFGAVTHCEAARKMAIKASTFRPQRFAFFLVETRCEDHPETIHTHHVQHREEFVVLAKRGDS